MNADDRELVHVDLVLDNLILSRAESFAQEAGLDLNEVLYFAVAMMFIQQDYMAGLLSSSEKGKRRMEELRRVA